MNTVIRNIRPLSFDDRARQLVSKAFGESVLSWAELYESRIEAFHVEFDVWGRKGVGYFVRPKGVERPPAIVYCRGWSGEFGMLRLAHAFAVLGPFAAEGYAVFAPQYAGNGGSEGLDEIGGQDLDDVLIAPKVFRDILKVTPERFGVFGESRGAIMAYRVLAQVDWINAVAVRWGIVDLERNAGLRPDLAKTWKDHFPQTPDSYADRSALEWQEKLKKDVPILLMHGTCDWRVSPLDSLDLARAFTDHGIPYRLVCFEGADHGLSEFKEEAFAQMIAWFDRFVKHGEPTPTTKPHGK